MYLCIMTILIWVLVGLGVFILAVTLQKVGIHMDMDSSSDIMSVLISSVVLWPIVCLGIIVGVVEHILKVNK